jgi:tRNA(adenine34) deaminase
LNNLAAFEVATRTMAATKHEEFMRLALEEAVRALEEDEVPVGALIVCSGKVVAKAHDQKESRRDPTAHAELLAIQRAAHAVSGWRLLGCELYCTLEPCAMCVGAMLQARIKRLIYGAKNLKFGAVETHAQLLTIPAWNHKIEVVSGVLAETSAELLARYFKRKRA